MTKVDKKLNKIYINLWSLYYPTSLSEKMYIVISLNTKIRKIWVFYLYFKDKFVNIF